MDDTWYLITPFFILSIHYDGFFTDLDSLNSFEFLLQFLLYPGSQTRPIHH